MKKFLLFCVAGADGFAPSSSWFSDKPSYPTIDSRSWFQRGQGHQSREFQSRGLYAKFSAGTRVKSLLITTFYSVQYHLNASVATKLKNFTFIGVWKVQESVEDTWIFDRIY